MSLIDVAIDSLEGEELRDAMIRLAPTYEHLFRLLPAHTRLELKARGISVEYSRYRMLVCAPDAV
jgi:hypothetical protein